MLQILKKIKHYYHYHHLYDIFYDECVEQGARYACILFPQPCFLLAMV